jgi:hypothetical protein
MCKRIASKFSPICPKKKKNFFNLPLAYLSIKFFPPPLFFLLMKKRIQNFFFMWLTQKCCFGVHVVTFHSDFVFGDPVRQIFPRAGTVVFAYVDVLGADIKLEPEDLPHVHDAADGARGLHVATAKCPAEMAGQAARRSTLGQQLRPRALVLRSVDFMDDVEVSWVYFPVD